MIIKKELGITQELLAKVLSADLNVDSSQSTLDAVTQEFSALLLQLTKQNSNLFGNLRNYELPEIRHHRRLTKQFKGKEFQANLITYQKLLLDALERTADYITDYL